MRLPRPAERVIWQTLWGRNPLTLGLIGLLPCGKVDRPIFIVGSPRSGTSVFSRYFGAHPQLSNWSEGHALFDPFYFNRSSEHRWDASVGTALGAHRVRANVYWFTKYIRYRQRLPIRRFTNKLPRHTVRIPWLLKVFPDAQFVHIIRDGRAVVRSMIRVIEKHNLQDRPLGSFARPPGWQEYYKADPYEAHSRQWVGLEEIVQQDLEGIDPSRVFRTKYEDFIQNTRNIMREICQQFDLRADDQAVNRWPERLENRNVKWTQECTREQIETMRKWLTPMLIHYGYESRLDWPIPDDGPSGGADAGAAGAATRATSPSTAPAEGTKAAPRTPVAS